MTTHYSDPPKSPQPDALRAFEGDTRCPLGDAAEATETPGTTPKRQPVPRGITGVMSSWRLQEAIWLRSLTLANRFRVIRTIEIAVHCFAERPFKAALSAAQRAVRGMVKARLLARYRTDRFMTVYGLTQRGVDWLADHGVPAAASVRRVADMTNPEHRLWAQFLTLCAEARGLRARTEQEMLIELQAGAPASKANLGGFLKVKTIANGRCSVQSLRPDAACFEADGMTWFEVDRSARGSDRAASLRALVLSIGEATATGDRLRRVVVYSRTDRIKKRVLATLDGLVASSKTASLTSGRRQLKPIGEDQFEVWLSIERSADTKRSRLVDLLVGHVIVQELPVWLPRVRLDGRGGFTTEGWFGDNYLPYRRPPATPPWSMPTGKLTA